MLYKNIKLFSLFFAFTLIIIPMLSFGQKIVPLPQKIKIKVPENECVINNNWSIVIPQGDENHEQMRLIAARMSKELKEKGLSLKTSYFDEKRKINKAILIVDPKVNKDFNSVLFERGLSLKNIPYPEEDQRYSEGYLIDVEPESIIIVGGGEPGLFYGTRTLIQLLQLKKNITGLQILDYPDNKWRGLYLNFKHIECEDQDSSTERSMQCINKIVKKYSDLKMNHLIFRGHFFYEFEKHKDFLNTLFLECRKNFIEPIPSIESKLENLPLINSFEKDLESKISSLEGVYIKSEPFYVGEDLYLHPLSPLKNSIKNFSFEDDFDNDKGPDQWNSTFELSSNGLARLKTDKALTGEYVIKIENLTNRRFSSGQDFPKTSKIFQEIRAQRDSYYIFSFWGRTIKNNSKVKIYITQKDGSERNIRYAGFQRSINLNRKWEKILLPVFTNNNCQKVTVTFESDAFHSRDETVLIDDVELYRMNGGLLNVAYSKGSAISVEAENGMAYSPSKDYIVDATPFIIRPKDSIKKLEGLKIKMTDGSGAKPGETVYISYDSMPLDPNDRHSKKCPSNPKTYEEYRQAFFHLISLSPKYININMDEHRGGLNRDSLCLKRNLSNHEIYIDFINSLNKILHEKEKVYVSPIGFIKGLNKPQIRLIIWDDMINPWHNAGGEKGEKYQLRFGGKIETKVVPPPKNISIKNNNIELSKDIIIAIWWYKSEDPKRKMEKSLSFFESKGYEYFVCPWYSKKNIASWSRLIHKKKSLGMMDTTFNGITTGVRDVSNYSWHSISTQF